MTKISKRYVIKIPKNVSFYYSEKYKALIVRSPLRKAVMKLDVKLLVSKKTNVIKITREAFYEMSQNKKKRLKVTQGTHKALLKQLINDIATVSFKKLRLVGIGYKSILLNISGSFLLNLRLGYSHSIFFKIPKQIKVSCIKANSKIYLSGNAWNFVSQLAALIRTYKMPEPYKGKGILYADEQIIFKEGKKL